MATISGWLPRNDSPGRWICRGSLFEIRQHFVPELGKSARCNAPDFCPLCAHDLALQSFHGLPISKPDSHVIHLLRLLEKDRAAWTWLERKGSATLGMIIDLQLIGYLEIAPIAKRTIPLAPIENYLRAIGRKAYFAAVEGIRDRPMADRSESEAAPVTAPHVAATA